MANVFDVAKYMLRQQGIISTWKLQKLCYYAQTWSLAWTERELFSEDFEAWSNGPVCRELFNEHKGLFRIGYSDLKKGNPEKLTSDEQDTVNVVLSEYGYMSPYELRELSHSEDPWKVTRGNLPDGCHSEKIIFKSLIGSFYGGL